LGKLSHNRNGILIIGLVLLISFYFVFAIQNFQNPNNAKASITTGATHDMADSGQYNIRFVGAEGDWLGRCMNTYIIDLNLDGKNDLIIGAEREITMALIPVWYLSFITIFFPAFPAPAIRLI